MASPGPRSVQCYHCRHRFEVGARAMTVSCPKCAKSLRVDDVVVKSVHSVTRLQTCGRVIVQRKGRVIARLVEAHAGVEVLGIMEADVLSGRTVRIGPKATFKGDCRCPSVRIESGALILGGYFAVPDDSLGLSDLGSEPVAPGSGSGREG